MARNAVGFYWTLPVRWAGFIRLPDDRQAGQFSRMHRLRRKPGEKISKDQFAEIRFLVP